MSSFNAASPADSQHLATEEYPENWEIFGILVRKVNIQLVCDPDSALRRVKCFMKLV
jgi:hypothetical protein